MFSTKEMPSISFLAHCKVDLIIPKDTEALELLINKPNCFKNIKRRNKLYYGEHLDVFLILLTDENLKRNGMDKDEEPPFSLKEQVESLYHYMDTKGLDIPFEECYNSNTNLNSPIKHWTLNSDIKQPNLLYPSEHEQTDINQSFCHLIFNPNLTRNYYTYFYLDNKWCVLFNYKLKVTELVSKTLKNEHFNLGVILGKSINSNAGRRFKWSLSGSYLLNYSNNNQLAIENKTRPDDHFLTNGIKLKSLGPSLNLQEIFLSPAIYHIVKVETESPVNVQLYYKSNDCMNYCLILRIKNKQLKDNSLALKDIKMEPLKGKLAFMSNNDILPMIVSGGEEISLSFCYYGKGFEDTHKNTNLNLHKFHLKLVLSGAKPFTLKFILDIDLPKLNNDSYKDTLNFSVLSYKMDTSPLPLAQLSHSSQSSVVTIESMSSAHSIGSKMSGNQSLNLITSQNQPQTQSLSNIQNQLLPVSNQQLCSTSSKVAPSAITLNNQPLYNRLIVSYVASQKQKLGYWFPLKVCIYNDSPYPKYLTLIIPNEPIIAKSISPIASPSPPIPLMELDTKNQMTKTHHQRKLSRLPRHSLSIHNKFLKAPSLNSDLSNFITTNTPSLNYIILRPRIELPLIPSFKSFECSLYLLPLTKNSATLPNLHVLDRVEGRLFTVEGKDGEFWWG